MQKEKNQKDLVSQKMIIYRMNLKRHLFMKKLKTKEFKGYTPEQLAYFQAQEDMNDGVDLSLIHI